MIQLYNRGEPLANKAADSSTKGVVGSMGRNTPINPNKRDNNPNNV